MPDTSRRLARLLRPQGVGTASMRTATVVTTDEDVGTATVTIPNGEGTLEVEGVRYASGITPQPGAEVAITMNGSEPFILSESGSESDPVFTGRIRARSFTALPGENLLAAFGADTSPWEGWDTVTANSTAVTADLNDDLIVTTPASTVTAVFGPEVPITRSGWYTASAVVSNTATGATSQPTSLVMAWVTLVGFDATGAVVQTTGGDLLDYPRGAAPVLSPRPMSSVEFNTDPNAIDDDGNPLPAVATAQMTVYFRNVTTGTLTTYIRSANIASAPIFEGGVLNLGDTVIDSSGITLAGESITSPWNQATTSADGATPGTITTRWQRVGRTVHYFVKGRFNGAMPGAFWLVHLPVPPNDTTILPAVAYDVSVGKYYDSVAYTDPSLGTIASGIYNGVAWSPTTPFTWANGDYYLIAGTYQAD